MNWHANKDEDGQRNKLGLGRAAACSVLSEQLHIQLGRTTLLNVMDVFIVGFAFSECRRKSGHVL